MDRYGYEMTIETARFWNSRLEWIEENNRYEIRDVIGPDEYKEHVDNNAYTNYMAHENMRLAAQVIACIRDEKKDIYGKIQKLMQEEGTSLEQLEDCLLYTSYDSFISYQNVLVFYFILMFQEEYI